MQRAQDSRAHLEWALRQPGPYGRPISAAAAAIKLNERNIPSPRGAYWWASTVRRMWKLLGLRHPAGKRNAVRRMASSVYWGVD